MSGERDVCRWTSVVEGNATNGSRACRCASLDACETDKPVGACTKRVTKSAFQQGCRVPSGECVRAHKRSSLQNKEKTKRVKKTRKVNRSGVLNMRIHSTVETARKQCLQFSSHSRQSTVTRSHGMNQFRTDGRLAWRAQSRRPLVARRAPRIKMCFIPLRGNVWRLGRISPSHFAKDDPRRRV
jgi:hypothetical protein